MIGITKDKGCILGELEDSAKEDQVNIYMLILRNQYTLINFRERRNV